MAARLIVFELSPLWAVGPCPKSLAEQFSELTAMGFEVFVTGGPGLVPVAGPWWHEALELLLQGLKGWLDAVAARGSVRHLLWQLVPPWVQKGTRRGRLGGPGAAARALQAPSRPCGALRGPTGGYRQCRASLGQLGGPSLWAIAQRL